MQAGQAQFLKRRHSSSVRRRSDLSGNRSKIERELARVKRDHGKLVNAILEGVPPEHLKDKMIALDTDRKDLEAQLATAETSAAPLRFHPRMSETYRDRVAFLLRGLASGKPVALRGLIEEIVLTPAEGEDCGLALDLHGALASLLRLAPVDGAMDGTNTLKACRVNSQALDNIGE